MLNNKWVGPGFEAQAKPDKTQPAKLGVVK